MQDEVSVKSQVAYATSLYQALWSDLTRFYPEIQLSLQMDLDYLLTRLKSEGFQFASVELPSFGRSILSGLESGSIETPVSFKKRKGSGLPLFLGGLLEKLFFEDGTVMPNLDVPALADTLQICMMCAKVKIPHTQLQEREVLDNFLSVESQLYEANEEEHPILGRARSLVSRVFSDSISVAADLYPRHGPGSVATGELGDEKWTPRRKYKNLHRIFGYYNLFWLNSRHLVDTVEQYRALELCDESCALISFVPKDSRGPRVISMEPLEIQFAQQSVAQYMMNRIEQHRLTRGHVNFSDQSVNGKLALESSRTKRFATLDMKDASDRVSVDLVKAVFSDTPLLRYLLASRSDATELPDGTKVYLKKFAPMGSAVCFPVESLIFYSLAVASLVDAGFSEIESRRGIYVYGDDLIVKTEYVGYVLAALPLFGLKFNDGKCFVHGLFRESCGVDAYNGHQITPTRWRSPWKEHLSGKDVVSQVSFANQLYLRGYLRAAGFVGDAIQQCVSFSLPVCFLGANPGFVSLKTRFRRMWAPHRRWNKRLQRLAFLVPMVKRSARPSKLQGWTRALHYLLLSSQPPNIPVPRARLKIKLGWSSSF